MFLAACIVAFMIYKTWVEGRLDHEYAKQGLVSPRLGAKYGDNARAKTGRYGLRDYLADAWSDNWANRTEIRRAAREAARSAPPAEGKSTATWRDRLAAAKRGVLAVGRVLIEPVGEGRRRAEDAQRADERRQADRARRGLSGDCDTAPDHDPATCPHCAAFQVDDKDGRRESRRQGRNNCGRCGADLGEATGETILQLCDSCLSRARQPSPVRRPPPSGGETAPRPTPDTQYTETPGGQMSPTGEALNYETTVSELNAILAELRKWFDESVAAGLSIMEAKVAIDGIQQSYRGAASATGSINEHLQTLLPGDAETLAQVGTVGDAMPPTRVDTLLEHLELVEAEAKQQQTDAEVAIAATEAALQRITQEYGEDAAKVADRMGGNAEFLNSGGGGGHAAGTPVTLSSGGNTATFVNETVGRVHIGSTYHH